MTDKEKLEIALRRVHYCSYGCDDGRNGNRLCDRCCIKALQKYVEALEVSSNSLLSAIRKHRDYKGDDRCWMDDEELYKTLPEGYTPPVRTETVELENCKRFIECRHRTYTEYVSPQRRIEELESEVALLKKQKVKLIEAALEYIVQGRISELRENLVSMRG